MRHGSDSRGCSLRSAVIILAGGLSKRFGQDKCMKELGRKALVLTVLDRVMNVADERVIVVGSEGQLKTLGQVCEARVVVDKYFDHSPLVGALTGFETVNAAHALLLPCDAAFVSPETSALLLDLCTGVNAVIPRWPDGKIEPLQAAYNVKSVVEAARTALNEGKRDMLGMISHLRQVRYVSTLVLQQFDEKLMTFLNINTAEDWKKAETLFRKSQSR
jgi:molybdopterin-guanine dinucleotide biosynthesis protein A